MPTFVQVTPSSVTTSGGSASITTEGSVEFSSASAVTLNGVFTSANEFYIISQSLTSTVSDQGWGLQMVLSASVDSGNNYDFSLFYPAVPIYTSSASQANNTVFLRGTGGRTSSNMLVTGPAQASPTTFTNTAQGILSGTDAAFYEVSGTHTQSIAYDGVHYEAFNGGVCTGTISVYKLEE